MSNFQGDHKAESVEQAAQPTLCANGCGFFANPSTNNMCSKCFRDTQMNAERKASNSKAAIAALSDVHSLPEVLGAKSASPATQSQQHTVQKKRQIIEEEPQEIAGKRGETGKAEASTKQSDDSMFERPAQKPGRCFSCNKKVGLTGFKCRCEYVFCGSHRLAEQHGCSFDYKGEGRKHLAESNPLIQAAKMDRL